MQGVWVRSLVGELRSHMPKGQKTKNIKSRSNIVTNAIKPLKMVQFKNKQTNMLASKSSPLKYTKLKEMNGEIEIQQ